MICMMNPCTSPSAVLVPAKGKLSLGWYAHVHAHAREGTGSIAQAEQNTISHDHSPYDPWEAPQSLTQADFGAGGYRPTNRPSNRRPDPIQATGNGIADDDLAALTPQTA